MKWKWLIVATLALAMGVWLASTIRQQRQLADEAEKLLSRRAAQPAESSDPLPSEFDLDQLAEKNRGMAVPEDLVVAKSEQEGYWFVGKHEDGSGVEIPFAPGRLPTPPPTLEPVHENPGYVGPDACRSCHPKYYDSFVHTAHYNTSQRATESTMEGQFDPGRNQMRTSDPNVSIEMLKRGDEYLQRVSFFNWKFDVPMHLIFGSSKMAQTYLYWHRDQLYQLNVTHLTEGDQWINSPGYIDGDAAYARPVPERCMDCHTTYFDFRKPPNHYTPGSLILGVTCERCHGPGEEHVNHHQQHPEQKDAYAITVPSDLSRERELEVCGQCHAGSTSLKGAALRYRPGDPLFDFYYPADDEADSRNSVHTSNQLTRLAESRCFQASEMTCVDCHNPHRNERNQVALFSQRCLACHQQEHPSLAGQPELDLAQNCIDCHMPARPTEELRLKSVQGDVFPSLRDHLIRVDAQATADFLQRQTQSE